MVALSNVRFGKRNGDVKVIQRALIGLGFTIPTGATGLFCDETKSAYAAWQHKLGFVGGDTDGFPGCSSLTKVGPSAQFKVDCRHPGGIAKNSVRFSKNSGIPQSEDAVRAAEQACVKTGAPPSWGTGAGDGAILITLTRRESSFRSNAVNVTDRNATGPVRSDGAKLNCSRAYTQVIPETFAENHQEGTSD